MVAANRLAALQGVTNGMVVADARALVPGLQVIGMPADFTEKILNRMAIWCIRFSPVTAPDPPSGLVLDITGCAHLWGGEETYYSKILERFCSMGYSVRGAIADTLGAAWAVAHYEKTTAIIAPSGHLEAPIKCFEKKSNKFEIICNKYERIFIVAPFSLL